MRPVTFQKEDNYGGAYAGLIYSQFWWKGLFRFGPEHNK